MSREKDHLMVYSLQSEDKVIYQNIRDTL
jgi:hypothetical protein